MDVHNGKSPELYPVSLGIKDDNGKYHLIEASRMLPRQLHVWAKSLSHLGEKLPIISPISTVILTHLHLGHIDGIGQFGREVIGAPDKSIRLITGKRVVEELGNKSYLGPFASSEISNGSQAELGKGVSLEFWRVPHREQECGETYGIVVRGKQKSILFLPDHDTYKETLAFHKMKTIKEWLKTINVDIALLDGTFFTVEEVAGRRKDCKGIPHPPISESLELLGNKNEDDPEIVFIHLNHTNPVIDDESKRQEIETKGWKIGVQGQVWEI